jgi:hypothetical protein
MKQALILATLLFLGTLSCNSSKSKEQKHEQLTLRFHPSFTYNLDFTLNIEEDKGEIIYHVYHPRNPATGIPEKTVEYDSLKFVVSGSDYIQFIETIRSIKIQGHKSLKKEGGIDGIITYVQYISKSLDTTQFDFWSPLRANYPLEYQVLDAFFDFTEKVFTDKKQLDYLEKLKEYFEYNRRIKKNSDSISQ